MRKNLPVDVLELVDWQVHLSDDGVKYGTFICTIFLEHIRKIDAHKTITNVVMFDVASNIQIFGELLKIYYPKLTVMHGVEHTVSLSFNDAYKIPIVNQIIAYHKAIYNLFGSMIYHKPLSILK